MAQRKAEWQNNYIAKTYDRINLLVKKGDKAKIEAAAKTAGESVTAYINAAIAERMQKEDNQCR